MAKKDAKDWRHRGAGGFLYRLIAGKPATEPKSTGQIVLEWIEALAVALILAVLIRFFVIEAFKIPSKSMQPTLMGDERHGDRILVNKFIYDLEEPERWDIVVFKKPSDPATNYIKRLIGLPGEEVQVLNGDIYINGNIARKPPEIEAILLQEAFSEARVRQELASQLRKKRPGDAHAAGAGADSFADHFKSVMFRYWYPDSGSWSIADGQLHVDATQVGPDGPPALVSYNEAVRDVSQYSGSPYAGYNIVADQAIEFDFAAEAPGGELVLQLRENDKLFQATVPLTTEGGPARLTWSGEEVAASEPLQLGPTRKHHARYSHIDDRIMLLIDGAEVIRYEYDIPPEEVDIGKPMTQAKFGARGAAVRFTGVSLDRDVYYTDPPAHGRGEANFGAYGVGRPTAIPDDSFYFLGDNSSNSEDSRWWGFVPRANLVGEAFFIFRPIKRWRIIR